MVFKKSAVVAMILVCCVFQPKSVAAADKIRIVATTSTIASLAQEITGGLADIHYVASAKRDVHFAAPNPKDVLKVKKADVFIHGGLDLEVWRQPLLDAAGNPAFLGNQERAIDVSRGIRLLEVPETLSRAEGDIHVFGNPHYWLDPHNAKIMADNIAEKLSQIFPQHQDRFRENLGQFHNRLDEKLRSWKARMAPFQNTTVIVYHKSWPYFADRYGLTIIGEIEPKPGIPPSAKHIGMLLKMIPQERVQLIITESFRDSSVTKKISKETGIPVVTLAQAVGENERSSDYLTMMEHNIWLVEEALTRQGDRHA